MVDYLNGVILEFTPPKELVLLINIWYSKENNEKVFKPIK